MRGGAAVALAGLLALAAAAPPEADSPRLRAYRKEIDRLRGELAALGAKETGLLGELTRLNAELRLREAEAGEAATRLEATERALAEHDRALGSLEAERELRLSWLRFRLRETYKSGPQGTLWRLTSAGTGFLDGLRYAAWLSERDAEALRRYREARVSVAAERGALAAEKVRYSAIREESEAARAALEAKRRERTILLEAIRGDRAKHEAALSELEAASRELGRLVVELGREAPPPPLDVSKFRGLVDWPTDAAVAVPYGDRVHPRFKTAVPHPGIDFAVPFGGPVRAIFDGRVVYASHLHGYGLTAIVDHGGGIVSVYARLAVLTVARGDEVARSQIVGNAGSDEGVDGSGLYFEIREDGKPVDPRKWLRRR